VRQVVVTHYHEDHGGNLAPIRRAFAAPVYAPRLGLLGREGLMTVLTGYHFSKRNLIDACLLALPGAAGNLAN